MPFLVKTISNGAVGYRITTDKPRLQGKQKYLFESLTRCLGWVEITQAEADLGLTKLLEHGGLVKPKAEDFYAGA